MYLLLVSLIFCNNIPCFLFKLLCFWQLFSVCGSQICTYDHDDQSDDVRERRQFPENKQGQSRAYERRYCIVGTGFGGTQIPLCINVKINTQAVSYKTKQQSTQDIEKVRHFFTNDQGNDQRSQSGTETFDHHDFQRIFGGKHTGAVIFKTPADTCQEYENRTVGKREAAHIFKG